MMNFESLMKQLNELERAKRHEECRYLNEKTAHEATEAELEAAQRAEEEAKEKARQLESEVARAKVDKRSLRAQCDQLVLALASSREEVRTNKDQYQKKVEEANEKRDAFTNSMKNILPALRVQQIRYSEAVRDWETPAPRPSTTLVLHGPEAEAAPPSSVPQVPAAPSAVMPVASRDDDDDDDDGEEGHGGEGEGEGKRAAAQLEEELHDLQEKYDSVVREFDALDRYSRSVEKYAHRAEQLMKSADVECPQCRLHLRICSVADEDAEESMRWVAAPVPQ